MANNAYYIVHFSQGRWRVMAIKNFIITCKYIKI